MTRAARCGTPPCRPARPRRAERIRAGDPGVIDPLTAPFEKLSYHAPDDPAFFFEHLCRVVFQAGIS